MADDSPALVGVESCGCVTYANARPDDLDQHDQRAIGRIVASGGQVLRTTAGKARKMPNFLAVECPHDPKGWEPEPYEDPADRVKVKDSYAGRGTVYRGWTRIGQVGRFPQPNGKWYATKGWLRRGTEPSADDGSEQRQEVEVDGPFSLRREAVAVLTGDAS